MTHLQYMPGDPRLVDQLVYELKSKGIFDQFRKDCIADVDTRPAYQNLRQRVENSVSMFLSRQTWQPDLNKNQLREKLRKHILDGNYLEQGVERIVDQVVNPKVASVFIPKVEELVYNYLGIARKKPVAEETSNGKVDDLLPTDLEAVSPGSVKSNDDKNEDMQVDNSQEENKMEVDEDKSEIERDVDISDNNESKTEDIQLPNNDSNSDDKSNIPLPKEEIKPENIPPPESSPPKVELETIELPKERIVSTNIPLPENSNKEEKDRFFKPINSDDDGSSSDSSLRRNMSPLTPIRNFNNENSCDAQQGFDNDLELKDDRNNEPSLFKFMIDAKSPEIKEEVVKIRKKETDADLSYQFNNQVNINSFNTPLYEDSSNSNNLQIDYESDANSKANIEAKVAESDQNSEDSKKERKEGKKNNNKSPHRSRSSHKHSSSKDKRSDSKHSSSRDSRHDKSRSSKDENKSKSSDKESSRDRNEKKDNRDPSRHSSNKSSHKDSKSHRSSSSSHRHSSSKHSDDKKASSSSSQKDKEKSDKSMDKPKESKSTSHRSDKDRKGSSSSSSRSDKSSKHKHDSKDKDKKSKKDTDDHYSMSGRNNPNRRSTDRDSNDGSSSSKGSNPQSSSKTSENKKGTKSSSKSESTSTSGDSTSPSDKENKVKEHGANNELQNNPIRLDSHLERPVVSPPRLPFVPDITIKKPKFAANLQEAKRLMKIRKFLDEEQKRMNQEAVLLLEFQANVRPSLSQAYSSIPGPELEFACMTNSEQNEDLILQNNENTSRQEPHYTNNQLLNVLNDATIEVERKHREEERESNEIAIKYNENNEVIRDVVATDVIDYKENNLVNENKNDEESNSKERVEIKTEFEITIVAEELSEDEQKVDKNKKHKTKISKTIINEEAELLYFAEHEKYNAELERVKFSNFYKEYTKSPNKLYVINCDTYEENLIRDESKKFGNFEIISYQKNGHLKLPNIKNVIKNVNIANEISLPMDNDYDESLKSSVFSPDKSECSFELSDYDAKLEEMVNKTSRQEIMEIILGNANTSPTKMPTFDYFNESKIENTNDYNFKRKIDNEIINNNRHVLTPNKIRRLSTEQITSTTQEHEDIPNNKLNPTRSKYLGKAKRVGLPRPKRAPLPNSPSSDKSVENYEQSTPNGKIKRNLVQRYDTSDLYKPKLHFLSRRNPVT